MSARGFEKESKKRFFLHLNNFLVFHLARIPDKKLVQGKTRPKQFKFIPDKCEYIRRSGARMTTLWPCLIGTKKKFLRQDHIKVP